jgi:hypothetical protein
MLTGAAPEVGHRFRTPLGRAAVAGIALGVTVLACHRSQPARPAAPAPAEKPATTPAESAIPAAPPAPRGKQIVVAYSSNILGEYEPCG